MVKKRPQQEAFRHLQYLGAVDGGTLGASGRAGGTSQTAPTKSLRTVAIRRLSATIDLKSLAKMYVDIRQADAGRPGHLTTTKSAADAFTQPVRTLLSLTKFSKVAFCCRSVRGFGLMPVQRAAGHNGHHAQYAERDF